MGFRCKQPGCGYEFPERPSDKCPSCERSPFESEGTFSPAEIKGKKILKKSNLPKIAQRSIA